MAASATMNAQLMGETKMTTAELLNEYQRLLRQSGPDSAAAYDLLMSHVEEGDFIHLAEEARSRYVQRQKTICLLLVLTPFYLCLVTVFCLMMWLG